ncbi:MAG: hypothetical protein ACKV2T_01265 [Kofleriaceae bacterium]
MRRVVAFACVLGPAIANAAPSDGAMTVEGVVVEASAKWVGDHDRIVTEAVVQTGDGAVVVSQLGGHVDGLTMRVFHRGRAVGEPLVPGMRVAVSAHRAQDLEQRTHVLVDDVRVLAYPAGYVRTGPTMAGASLYWESGCVFVSVDDEGTKEIPGDTEFELVDRAIATWNDGIASCSYMEIRNEGRADKEVGRDFVNVIKFRDASWCRPAVKNDPMRCYAEAAAGLTTAVYVDDDDSDRDGAIVDADIELNGRHFAISHEGNTLGTAPCHADLLNTLTHELGHLLGLEHPCLAPGDPPRIDGNGNAVPACGQTDDPRIVESTMYNYQDCGETKKASLEADDIEGVCAIYPKAEDPGTCLGVSTDVGCCSAGGGPSGAAILLVCIGGFVVGRRRRR